MGGTLEVSNNASLVDLSGLEAVQSVQTLTVNGNTSLTSVDALVSLTTVTDALRVTSNPALVDVLGMSGQYTVGTEVRVSGNTELCADDAEVLCARAGIAVGDPACIVSRNRGVCP